MAVFSVLFGLVDKVGAIAIAIPPDVRHPTHVVVDIHSHDMAIFLFHALRRVLVKDYFSKLLDQPGSSLIFHFHLSYDVREVLYRPELVEAPDQEVQDIVHQLLLRAVPIEIEAHSSVHAEAKIVGEALQQVLLGGLGFFVDHVDYPVLVPFLDDIPLFFVCHHLHVPDIELLDLGLLNLHHEVVQFTEVIAKETVLPPSQILREVVAGAQRKRPEYDFVEVDILLDKLCQQPVNSAIAATCQRYNSICLRVELLAEAFQVLDSHAAGLLLVDDVEVD